MLKALSKLLLNQQSLQKDAQIVSILLYGLTKALISRSHLRAPGFYIVLIQHLQGFLQQVGMKESSRAHWITPEAFVIY